MSKVDDISKKWLQDTQKDLIDNYNRLGLRASGKWANSLKTEYKNKVTSINLIITGEDYTEQLENGRRPNQNQTPEALKKWVGWAGSTFLAKWVKDKGLSLSPFAVAWKIAREGWKVPNKNNAGGLVTDVVNKENTNKLIQDLGQAYIDTVFSDIRNVFS